MSASTAPSGRPSRWRRERASAGFTRRVYEDAHRGLVSALAVHVSVFEDLSVHDLDGYGRSPLHYAALSNDLASARARIAAGDDPSLGDARGFTPLHFAAQEGAIDVARLLLASGAHIDRADEHGNTPLMTAVFNSRGRGDLIELLRENGADPLLANSSGQTPVGLARLIGNFDVAQYFEDVPG